ncbi:hypothetical protein PRZ48_008184 [Zasmidium cellare]|uniref:SGNH hydrolase-type esterase domain-containing protein n=1 Tax=Zasmidium cellare TaxID=395010 RepID=A0ABR0EFL7_ZASCE|nr:hypothetical protein PRZ48_008184 [Zasmidium cellare]
MFLRRFGPFAVLAVLLIILFYGYSRETQPLVEGKGSNNVHACAVSPKAPLRIVPTGDSITEGEGSSDYNGYRLFLYRHLMEDCNDRSVEFVGTRRSGLSPDPSIQGLEETEGYSGWDIERLLNFSMDPIAETLSRQPNVMLLHIGTSTKPDYHMLILTIGTNNVAPLPLRPPDIVAPEDSPEKLEQLIDEILKLAPSIVLIVAQIITSPNFGWKDNTPIFNAPIPDMVEKRRAKGFKIMTIDMSSVGTDCVRDFDNSPVDCEDINGDGLHPKDEGYRKMAGFWYEALVEATKRGWPSSLPGLVWNKKQYQTQLEDPEMSPMATLAFIIFMIFNIASIIKVRRRVSISSIQGRPLGFSDQCFSVQVPEKPQTLELEESSSPSWLAAGITRYSHHNFKLQKIVSSIKSQLYDRQCELPWPDDPPANQKAIHGNLKAWWESTFGDGFALPEVDVRYTRVWKLKLQIKFYTAMILLFQPSQAIKNPSDDSLQVVFDSATYILRDYQLLHDSSNLDYGWRTVQNTFAAGAALIYSFWTSKMVRARAEAMAMSKTLRTCPSLLSIGGEWWPSAKASLTAFGSIADLTIQEVYSNQHKSKRRRQSSPDPRIRGPQNSNFHEAPQPDHAGMSSDRTAWGAGDPGRGSGSMNSMPSHEHFQFAANQAGNDPSFDAQMEPQWQLDFANTSPHDPWIASYTDVEQFLAGFDRSEFSWNVPMNDMGKPFDLNTTFR